MISHFFVNYKLAADIVFFIDALRSCDFLIVTLCKYACLGELDLDHLEVKIIWNSSKHS